MIMHFKKKRVSFHCHNRTEEPKLINVKVSGLPLMIMALASLVVS